jgi:hypothetical protein
MAIATASARLCAPNFLRAFATCHLTVGSEMCKSSEIILLVSPEATPSSTWRSRFVSVSTFGNYPKVQPDRTPVVVSNQAHVCLRMDPNMTTRRRERIRR